MAGAPHESRGALPSAHLKAAVCALERKRGRAAELERLFDDGRVPMVWIDNAGRCLDANPASRLFLRRTLTQLRALRLQDLLPPSKCGATGRALGTTVMRAPDGARVPVDYCAVPNLLPGRHLFVWVPMAWREEELGELVEEPPEELRGRLSEREREVLAALSMGAGLDEISAQLHLSPHTVKTHLRNALRRLGARHRAHAITLALRDGEI